MRYDKLSNTLTTLDDAPGGERVMAKLLFDPVTYQFYYRCLSEETAAKAAGFRGIPFVAAIAPMIPRWQ